ncbi:hypothetical protein PM8797T_15431 [Gimesia maris DSM 8797]|nr:hypothetical protein PM8797T_15431 [Gimesia maris DSM 8797]
MPCDISRFLKIDHFFDESPGDLFELLNNPFPKQSLLHRIYVNAYDATNCRLKSTDDCKEIAAPGEGLEKSRAPEAQVSLCARKDQLHVRFH